MIGYRSRSKNGKAPERMIAAIGSRANDYRFDRRWPSPIRVGCPSVPPAQVRKGGIILLSQWVIINRANTSPQAIK